MAEILSAVRRVSVILILMISSISMFVGCGTLPNGRGWGEDATLTPGWRRIKQTAYSAAVAPETWAPAAGALALQIGNADKNISTWAAKNTPVYGSQEKANRASDYLRDAAEAAFVITAAATPSGEEFEDWAFAKAKGVMVEAGAVAVTRQTVGYLKQETGRMRPNRQNEESFPSAHSSDAAIYSTLASRNIESLRLPGKVKVASQLGLGAVTAATAWARVEGNQHYPSDVLAGIAISHFIGAFIYDAFLGIDNTDIFMPAVESSHNGFMLHARFAF